MTQKKNAHFVHETSIVDDNVEIGEKTLLCINRPIESADLRIEDFVGISFTHHMEILHKTTTLIPQKGRF